MSGRGRGGRGGGNSRGGNRGGGSGRGGGGRGGIGNFTGFNSPPSRGGSSNTPNRGRGGSGTNSSNSTPNRGRGGGGSQFTSPAAKLYAEFSSPAPRNNNHNTSRYSPYPPNSSGGGKPRFNSTPKFSHIPSANVTMLGEFGVDERSYKSAVSLSLKLGGQGMEDSHMSSVILPWLSEQFEPFLKRQYGHLAREQVQINLELQDNYLACDGVVQLMSYLSQRLTSPTGLTYRICALKLWNNQIGDVGCEAIAAFLVLLARIDVPLLELHLSHNLIGERGAAALMNAVYEYSRPDTTLTKLIGNPTRTAAASSNPTLASPERTLSAPSTLQSSATTALLSSPSSASASSPSPTPVKYVPFDYAATCVDTAELLSAPAHPLWLRLEWNMVNYTLFQPNFAWLKQEPDALKREAKRLRRAQQKAALASAASASPAALEDMTRQMSNVSIATDSTIDLSTDAGDEATEVEENEADEVTSHADAAEEVVYGDEAEENEHEEGDDDADTLVANEGDAEAFEQQPPSVEDEDADAKEMEEIFAAAKPSPSSAAAASSSISSSSSSFPSSMTSASNSSNLPFTLPPPDLRICPAANRQTCSVRMCRYPHHTAHIHLCFFHLQHQSFENSDLLDTLKVNMSLSKRVKPQPMAERKEEKRPPSTPTVPITVSLTPADSVIASPLPTLSPTISVTSPSPSPSPSSARPLVLFLDSNSVFNMISSRQEVKLFHWNRLYELACNQLFGTCFSDPSRHVYLILCSAVLNEMDARKEYSKKSESGAFGQERFAHFSSLAKQIKDQFQMNVADQSKGFLAKCKNLGGVNQGFVKTISVAQGEMNVHPSLRPNANDTRNTSNDRRILNAALHWSQSVGESGIVLLLTDDRMLQNISTAEGVPVVSLYSLDRALARSEFRDKPLDSVTLRSAIASCSAELQSTLSDTNIQPSARTDKNVYECLQDAVEFAARCLENHAHSEDEAANLQEMLQCWKGVLANAPQLLNSLRQTARASPATPMLLTSPSPAPPK